MAITWRDIAAPDFRGAAAITAGANEAIQNSFKGLAGTFDKFGQQFVDKDTNAAIKSAMGLGNVNTVDADAARILASSGQDVDLAKYNAAVLQKADALRGTERFNREGQTFDQNIKLGNQNLTKGEQDIAANTAKALRQPILDQQADKLYGYTVDQQEFDKLHRPELYKKNLAKIDADINQSNAAARASGASANLSNAQIKKIQSDLVKDNLIKQTSADLLKEFAPTILKDDDGNVIVDPKTKLPKWSKVDTPAFIKKLTETGLPPEVTKAISSDFYSTIGVTDPITNEANKVAQNKIIREKTLQDKAEIVDFVNNKLNLTGKINWKETDNWRISGATEKIEDAVASGIPLSIVKTALSNEDSNRYLWKLKPEEIEGVLNNLGTSLNVPIKFRNSLNKQPENTDTLAVFKK